jgi:AraC-like DNA-binding protein
VLDLYLDRYSAGSTYLYVGLLLSWVLYIKILVTPEILYGYSFFIKKVRQQQNLEYVLKEIWVFEKDLAITNIQDLELNKKISTKVSNYIDDIETASLNKHLLRDETGNLGKFADQLEIPKSHLVYIFKYHSKFSFIEFRKTVRILDAVNLIETNYLNLNTLDCLAKKVGFSSYNTFFTSFKEVTGVTPRIFCQEYANKISIKSTLT